MVEKSSLFNLNSAFKVLMLLTPPLAFMYFNNYFTESKTIEPDNNEIIESDKKD